MADNEEREEATSRGNGWEVVSLASSAYTAASSSELVDANADIGHTIEEDEAMFMSGHFVFPPCQHENLPLEPEEDEVTFMPGAHLMDREQNMNTDLRFSSFYGETTTDEQMKPSEELLDSEMLDLSNNNAEDDDVYEISKLPCEAWWKRGATALYIRAKEANTFWSIVVAAAVLGLVVLGTRWHQQKVEILHLKWRLNFDNEKAKRLLGPISRSKELKL